MKNEDKQSAKESTISSTAPITSSTQAPSTASMQTPQYHSYMIPSSIPTALPPTAMYPSNVPHYFTHNIPASARMSGTIVIPAKPKDNTLVEDGDNDDDVPPAILPPRIVPHQQFSVNSGRRVDSYGQNMVRTTSMPPNLPSLVHGTSSSVISPAIYINSSGSGGSTMRQSSNPRDYAIHQQQRYFLSTRIPQSQDSMRADDREQLQAMAEQDEQTSPDDSEDENGTDEEYATSFILDSSKGNQGNRRRYQVENMSGSDQSGTVPTDDQPMDSINHFLHQQTIPHHFSNTHGISRGQAIATSYSEKNTATDTHNLFAKGEGEGAMNFQHISQLSKSGVNDSLGMSPVKKKTKRCPPVRSSRRGKIDIKYIDSTPKRHVCFTKRKAGLMKKAYELSVLTGTEVLLVIASAAGSIFTFSTRRLRPLITKSRSMFYWETILSVLLFLSPIN